MQNKKSPDVTTTGATSKDATSIFSTPSKSTTKLYYKKSLAVKFLEDLSFEAKKAKHPTVPYLSRDLFRDNTANGLTHCVIAYIRLVGGQSERINCQGGIKDNRQVVTDCIGRQRTIGSLTRIKTSGQRGTADISALFEGKTLKIEVKIGKDHQSEAQRCYQLSIEKSGGYYYIAKDFTSFLDWFVQTFGKGKAL